MESSLLNLRLVTNAPAVFLLVAHHLNCLKALCVKGLDLPGLLFLSPDLHLQSSLLGEGESLDLLGECEFILCKSTLGDSGEYPVVWASIDVPELDSPKVNRDIGPRTVVALGEFCDREREGEEGGEIDVAAARGERGDFLPPRGELMKDTVAVAMDEQTTGDIDLGEE